jgi:hypothetical protein
MEPEGSLPRSQEPGAQVTNHWTGGCVSVRARLDTLRRENLTVVRNRTQTVQPVARRYTD